jgi:hypothetical protein
MIDTARVRGQGSELAADGTGACRCRRANVTLTRRYIAAIDQRLAGVVAASPTPLSPHDVFVRMRGAFPTVVWSRLTAWPRGRLVSHGNSETGPFRRECIPELHPLDFEWYFTQDCAASLADMLCSRGTGMLCLGTPTVAVEAQRRGQTVALVDRSPHVAQRFPILKQVFQLHVMDVHRAERMLGNYDVVVFDAPWYIGDTSDWLSVAGRLAKTGGVIAFSLFPPLVRPTAASERDLLLTLAARIGAVTLLEGAVAYETPLFESEALHAAGISGFGDWRRGDLVIIKKRATLARPPKTGGRPHGAEAWRTYVIGHQVVKLRCQARPGLHRRGLVRPLPDARDFVFTSVSAHDRRRLLIDLWTSRNKVARIADLQAMASILESLEKGESLEVVIRSHYRAESTRRRARLEDTLRCLLG